MSKDLKSSGRRCENNEITELKEEVEKLKAGKKVLEAELEASERAYCGLANEIATILNAPILSSSISCQAVEGAKLVMLQLDAAKVAIKHLVKFIK